MCDIEKEENSLKNQTPVLYQRKAFSPSHSHLKISSKINIAEDTITTENVIPHLIKEAEREKETKESMESSMESVKTQRSKKSKWISALFLLLNLGILAGILIWQFCNEPPMSLPELLQSNLNWWWLIVAVLLFFLINYLDAFRIQLAIKKVTGRNRPYLSYKSMAICRYYDSITPLATGGQPFQVFYLNKRGLNASSATSVPLAKYIYAQVTYIIFSVIILLCSGLIDIQVDSFVLTLCYIGLALNLLLIVAIFFLSISKKVAPKMMFGIFKMLKWMHIIKDSRMMYRKVMRTVKEYVSTFRMFMTSGWLVFMEFLLSVFMLFAQYSIAFVVYCVFCDFNINLWYTFLTLQLICDIAISFIPIPGGAGTAEYSFNAIFYPYYATVGAGNVFVWAILLYRIMTYYGYLIQGGVVLLYDFVYGNKKIAPMLQRFKDEDMRKENGLMEVLEKNQKVIEVEAENKTDCIDEGQKDPDEKGTNEPEIKGGG
ncbi:MAG: flippase-like domain-containing protein [Clostridia bacterium]|nr:flippase-like domain-containing protein [Clostridia bacterium]